MEFIQDFINSIVGGGTPPDASVAVALAHLNQLILGKGSREEVMSLIGGDPDSFSMNIVRICRRGHQGLWGGRVLASFFFKTSSSSLYSAVSKLVSMLRTEDENLIGRLSLTSSMVSQISQLSSYSEEIFQVCKSSFFLSNIDLVQEWKTILLTNTIKDTKEQLIISFVKLIQKRYKILPRTVISLLVSFLDHAMVKLSSSSKNSNFYRLVNLWTRILYSEDTELSLIAARVSRSVFGSISRYYGAPEFSVCGSILLFQDVLPGNAVYKSSSGLLDSGVTAEILSHFDVEDCIKLMSKAVMDKKMSVLKLLLERNGWDIYSAAEKLISLCMEPRKLHFETRRTLIFFLSQLIKLSPKCVLNLSSRALDLISVSNDCPIECCRLISSLCKSSPGLRPSICSSLFSLLSMPDKTSGVANAIFFLVAMRECSCRFDISVEFFQMVKQFLIESKTESTRLIVATSIILCPSSPVEFIEFAKSINFREKTDPYFSFYRYAVSGILYFQGGTPNTDHADLDDKGCTMVGSDVIKQSYNYTDLSGFIKKYAVRQDDTILSICHYLIPLMGCSPSISIERFLNSLRGERLAEALNSILLEADKDPLLAEIIIRFATSSLTVIQKNGELYKNILRLSRRLLSTSEDYYPPEMGSDKPVRCLSETAVKFFDAAGVADQVLSQIVQLVLRDVRHVLEGGIDDFDVFSAPVTKTNSFRVGSRFAAISALLGANVRRSLPKDLLFGTVRKILELIQIFPSQIVTRQLYALSEGARLSELLLSSDINLVMDDAIKMLDLVAKSVCISEGGMSSIFKRFTALFSNLWLRTNKSLVFANLWNEFFPSPFSALAAASMTLGNAEISQAKLSDLLSACARRDRLDIESFVHFARQASMVPDLSSESLVSIGVACLDAIMHWKSVFNVDLLLIDDERLSLIEESLLNVAARGVSKCHLKDIICAAEALTNEEPIVESGTFLDQLTLKNESVESILFLISMISSVTPLKVRKEDFGEVLPRVVNLFCSCMKMKFRGKEHPWVAQQSIIGLVRIFEFYSFCPDPFVEDQHELILGPFFLPVSASLRPFWRFSSELPSLTKFVTHLACLMSMNGAVANASSSSSVSMFQNVLEFLNDFIVAGYVDRHYNEYLKFSIVGICRVISKGDCPKSYCLMTSEKCPSFLELLVQEVIGIFQFIAGRSTTAKNLLHRDVCFLSSMIITLSKLVNECCPLGDFLGELCMALFDHRLLRMLSAKAPSLIKDPEKFLVPRFDNADYLYKCDFGLISEVDFVPATGLGNYLFPVLGNKDNMYRDSLEIVVSDVLENLISSGSVSFPFILRMAKILSSVKGGQQRNIIEEIFKVAFLSSHLYSNEEFDNIAIFLLLTKTSNIELICLSGLTLKTYSVRNQLARYLLREFMLIDDFQPFWPLVKRFLETVSEECLIDVVSTINTMTIARPVTVPILCLAIERAISFDSQDYIASFNEVLCRQLGKLELVDDALISFVISMLVRLTGAGQVEKAEAAKLSLMLTPAAASMASKGIISGFLLLSVVQKLWPIDDASGIVEALISICLPSMLIAIKHDPSPKAVDCLASLLKFHPLTLRDQIARLPAEQRELLVVSLAPKKSSVQSGIQLKTSFSMPKS